MIVLEKFDPPVDMSGANPYVEKLSPCLPVEGVTWLSSYVAADGSQCVCVYEAPDAESVRRVYRSAGVPFEAVWPAAHLKP